MHLTDTPRGRKVLFALLYLCEGAPIGFIWWALPVHLAQAGLGAGAIAGLTSRLVLPWALKVFWAPAIDVLRSPRFTLRGWIVLSQLLMGLTLVPLLFLDPLTQLGWLTALLLAHGVCAATQDAAIDTLAISTVPEAERGAVTAWMQVGVLTSRALFGGGALALGSALGEGTLVWLLIGMLWGGALMMLTFGRHATGPATPDHRGERLARYAAHLRAMFLRRATWAGLALALLAGAAFEGLTGLSGVWLVDRGVAGEVIGHVYWLGAVPAMLAGSLLGGRLADRWPRRTAVAVTVTAMSLAAAALGLTALALPGAEHDAVLIALLVAVYLGVGLVTSTTYALFMDLTDPALAATQFCVFMAGVNLCESWSVKVLGELIETLGYGRAFALMALPSLAALVVLRWVRVGPPRQHAPTVVPPRD